MSDLYLIGMLIILVGCLFVICAERIASGHWPWDHDA